MGAPIAAVLRRVYPLAVYDIDADRAEAVAGSDVWRCGSVKELARSSGVILSVLPSPTDVARVAGEALPAMQAGALWIDCTSGAPEPSRELAALAQRHDVEVVSAPMGGSVEEAAAAQLVFYVSGPEDAVIQASPVLEVLAAANGIRRVGTHVEHAQIVKLLANALWFVNAAAASEAMLVGTALGLPVEHLHHLLRDSAGASRFLDRDMDRLLDGDYLTTFSIDRVTEELRSVAAMRSRGNVQTPLLDASAALHAAAHERFGSALGELLGVKLLEERAGRRLRR